MTLPPWTVQFADVLSQQCINLDQLKQVHDEGKTLCCGFSQKQTNNNPTWQQSIVINIFECLELTAKYHWNRFVYCTDRMDNVTEKDNVTTNS
jgi:hypothetical protein